ncbi:MAG TPA: hypothetical protein VJM31_17175 [Vicinamibacterales bacterium]|nr:hypothetical protein [Vicinamibacterales bacterium]
MFGPATIKFVSLPVGQLKFGFTFGVCQALPQGHRKFSPIAGGKLEEFGKRTRRHGLIVSRAPLACNPVDGNH